MANFNTIETVTLVDTDRTAVIKVTGVFNSTFNTNVTIIQANTLRFANASGQPIHRLVVTSIQYSTSVSPNGFSQLYFVGNSNPNVAIFNFGCNDDGMIDAHIHNTCTNPYGDIGLTIQGGQIGNTVNFVIALYKDNDNPGPGQGAWSNAYAFQN